MEAGVIPGYIILKVLASEPSHNSTYPPVTPFLALTATFQINYPHWPFFIYLLQDTSQFPSFHSKKWSQQQIFLSPDPPDAAVLSLSDQVTFDNTDSSLFLTLVTPIFGSSNSSHICCFWPILYPWLFKVSTCASLPASSGGSQLE